MSDSFDFTSLYQEFRDEAQQQLARLDAALLRLEASEELGEDERSSLLRDLHTLKGNSGMLALQPVADAVHWMEGVFRSPPAGWTQAVLDPLFELAAALRQAVDRVGTERQDDALQRLRAVWHRAQDAATRAGPPEQDGAPEAHPDPEQTGAAGSPGVDEGADPAGDLAATGDLLRVPFEKLDALLNRVGELVSAGAALEALVDRHAEELRSTGLRRALQAQVEDLQRVTQLVQESTMDLRLVSVRRLFQRFPSMVRDLARSQDKQVRVELEGESVELDKSTVDALGEPLLHLVRNAVDHGIGSPEQREAAGKPPVATIWLRARQAGDRVRVEVADDGAGLDRAAILARSREMGLTGPGADPSAEEIDQLIFRPGFSTRREATTVSGRGVGLDVVRRRLTELRGSLSVESRPGEGTRFVLLLPLTLAIVPALVFEAAGEQFALPAAEVEETVGGARLETAGRAEVIRHREELIPAARLDRVFGWRRPGDPDRPGRPSPFAIVLRRGPRSVAVLADRLLDQRDVVIKALPRSLGTSRGVSGAAVTPDDRVVLLLDVGGLLEMNLETHRRDDRAR